MKEPKVTDRDILLGIAEIAEKHLGFRGRIDPAARLVEDLQLDSLRLMTLSVAVEDRFMVTLEPEDEAVIYTVRDLLNIVRRKLESLD
jgi:acyl carrier protein